ncbi:GNAT family N-acetyltransferase [bacterium]|nr:MAG: GNAT family N-acetyltransferase [bacterium]
MPTIHLRPIDVDRDFGQLAALFSLVQDDPTSEADLKKDYADHRERIFCLNAAVDDDGELLGFNWATHDRSDPTRAVFYVIVWPERRGQGAGGRLYADVEQAARTAGIRKLEVSVRDTCPESRAFVERRGFSEHNHSIGMQLNLDAFDDQPYDALISSLKDEGFEFTSMALLGNDEDSQRRLYRLNDTAAAETMGSDGTHPWSSFEDFERRVCETDWYNPAGQMVVIDSATGAWAAMSAITRFAGRDYAYNLFTGVDARYRGRKLGQAVKVVALRYARDVLGAHSVRTHHLTTNEPILAIDNKFGYTLLPGEFVLMKELP